jgi:AsmA protein
MVLAASVGVMVLLGAGALFAIDRLLTSAARNQAARLSAQWQRPVEVGAVKLALLAGFGLRVEGVRIGAAAGESRPLLELDRAEVRLELLRALRSGGREVRVRSAELQGLRVNVLKLRDGTTNFQRLSGATDRDPPPAGSATEGEQAPLDLSRVRVDHAALLDARVALLDQAAGGAELLVEDLDLVVDGFAAGQPLTLVLKAGLLSRTQNLVLEVHAPPLPPTLIPAPDLITLKVEPIDLAPLAAFSAPQAGFQGGRFSADLAVALGAAVLGGSGPTTVRGGFKATALRFAGQQGGKALDVSLDADLAADARQGDLDIARLRLSFGPAALEGKGKVTGLRSERPRIEGLRVVSRDLDLAALAAYYPPLTALLGGTAAGPIGLSVQAAGTAEQPVVELRADLTPVRLDLAGRLRKAPGGPLSFSGRLSAGAGGALRFELQGDLTGLDLRPGGALAKKPGDRFTLAASGSTTSAGESRRLEVASFTMALLDLNLKAHGTVDQAPRSTRFDVAVAVDRLDVDRLLLPESPAPPGRAPAPAGQAQAPAEARGGRSPAAGLAGTFLLQLGEATAGKQRVSDLHARVVVKEDRVTLEEGRLGIWSGVLDLAGSQVRLGPPDRPFELAARVQRVQLGALLAAFTDQKVAEARLDAEVRLSGRGEGTDAILKALDGTVDGTLLDGVFHGKDLVAAAMEPVVTAAPWLGGRVTRGGSTSLGKAVPFSLRIQAGRAVLQRPIGVVDRGSTLTLQGSFSFDGELDLPATLSLAPVRVSELTGGRARLDSPLPISFTLAGKAWNPRLAGLDVKPAVAVLAKALGARAIGKALGLEAGGPQAEAPGAVEAGAPAKDRLDEDAAAAKKRAQDETDAARKKLERDASKALKRILGE